MGYNEFTTPNQTLFGGDDSSLHTFLNTDSIEAMNALPEASIPLIFADPPYNLSGRTVTCENGKMVKNSKGHWDTYQDEDFLSFNERWILAARRVLRVDGTIWISGTYHNIYQVGYLLQKHGFDILNDIAWFKPNAAPNLACNRLTASHETILWARKSPKAKFHFDYTYAKSGDFPEDFIKQVGKQMRSVWSIPTTPPSEKTFGKVSTQKPLALLRRIIRLSYPGEGLILDPFAGSATTLVAASEFGFSSIGYELDPERFSVGHNRLHTLYPKSIEVTPA